MPLINFGSILGFAEAIENQHRDFIKQAADCPECSNKRDLFEEMIKTTEKRIKEIQRARRENVTEMILENVEGFFKEPFLRESLDSSSMTEDKAVNGARNFLGRNIEYYQEASLKLKGQSEVSRALKTLSKKCKKDFDKLD